MNIQTWLTAAAILVFAAGCGSDGNKEAPKSGPKGGPVPVEGFVVKETPLSSALTLPGTLEPFEKVELRAEMQGRITQILFKEGEAVSKDKLLVKLFDADLQAEFNVIKQQHDLAKKNESRLREMLAVKGVSEAEYDQALSRVRETEAQMELIQAKIRRTEVRAPFSGKMGLRRISEGALVGPGDVLAVLVQDNNMKLDFSLPERYAYGIKGNEKISFTVQGQKEEFFAKILAWESAVESGSRSLRVRAVCPNNGGKLIPGAFASVRFSLQDVNDALMVPNQALIPEAKGKKAIVIRGGKAEFVSVTTGFRDAEKVQVLSGLQGGDTIAVTGLMSLRPESDVVLKTIQNVAP